MTQAPWLSPNLLPEHKHQGRWAMIEDGQPVPTTLEEIITRIKKGPGRPAFSGEPVNKVPVLVAAPDSPNFVPVADRTELRDVWLASVSKDGLNGDFDLTFAILFSLVWVLMGVGSGRWFGLYTILAIGSWAAVAHQLHFSFERRRHPDRVARELRDDLLFDYWNVLVSSGHKSRSTWMAAAMVLVLVAQFVSGLIDREGAGFLGITRAALDKSLWVSEPWRLVTAVVMHGGIFHLLFNLGGLFWLFGILDATRARWWSPSIWLIGALGGSLASAQVDSLPSVGASGGIIALMVFVMTAAWRDRHVLPGSFMKQLWTSVVVVALIGVIGIEYIDNAAHFGGAVVGFVIGVAFRMSGASLWATNPPNVAPVWSRIVDVLLISIVVFTLIVLLMPVSAMS